MKRITIYGKGGIGKSMVASNLCLHYARTGRRVLLVGCDPKADTTILVRGETPKRTVLDALSNGGRKIGREDIIMRGRHGIDCVESGGPKPGLGCGGRGVSRTLEVFRDLGIMDEAVYDIVIFDVLGDVVCGGFAAPLRLGVGDLIVIITSEELMSLYAANNIASVVETYAPNGIYLGGLIANLREKRTSNTAIDKFAKQIRTRVIGTVPRSAFIREAELQNMTVVEAFPDSEEAKILVRIAESILESDPEMVPVPSPIPEEMFMRFFRNDS